VPGGLQHILPGLELQGEGRDLPRRQRQPLAVLGVAAHRHQGLWVEHSQLQPQEAALLGDIGHAGLGRGRTQQGHVQQGQNGLGRLAVAVQHLVQQIRGVLVRADGGDAAVQVHPLFRRGDVPVRDMGVHRQVGGTLRLDPLLLATLLQDGLLQQLQVQVVAYAHEIPRLLRPQ
ncbi:Stage III sporulation protein AG, partial [Dysosmobacter welbionis]